MRPFSTTGGTTHCSDGTGEQPWRGVRPICTESLQDIQVQPKMRFFSAYFLKISLVCANKIAQPECYMRSQLSWKGVEQVHEKENKEEEEEEEEEGGTVRGTSLAPGASNRPVHTGSYRHCTLHNVRCNKHPNKRHTKSKCTITPLQQRA